MAVIACVDLDPLLVGLVRRARPHDEVVEVEAGELPDGRVIRAGAWVVGADSPAVAALRATPSAERMVLVADPGVPVTGHPGPVLRRPVEGPDLHVALARVLGPGGAWAVLRGRVPQLGASLSPEAIFAIARAVALTAAIALEVAQAGGSRSVLLPVLLLVWVGLRIWVRSLTPPAVTVDVVVAVTAIVLTGGTSSTHLLVAAVVAAEVGYGFPSRSGAVLVGTATVVGLVPLSIGMAAGETRPIDLVTWGTLIPVASLAGVMAFRVRRSREGSHVLALRQVNTTLGRLAREAQGVAGSLSATTVVEDVAAALRDKVGAIAGAVVLDDENAGVVRTVAASFGLTAEAPGRVVDNGDGRVVPADLDVRFPEGHRLAAPMRVGQVERGVLLAVVPWGRRTRGPRRQLAALAEEAALAVDNARIFEDVRELTVDDERRRLARDLHDGVIQTLVHVGFELDLLGRGLPEDAQGDMARLRGVVGRTVEEVRATVNGLRSVRLTDGLGAALVALGREYDSVDVPVSVEVDPVSGLSPEAELQLLRIAQEALSNALQHARPSSVRVRLWSSTTGVHLQVDDDGVGPPAHGHRTTTERGVGLRAMKERADLLDAELVVEPGAVGGTCVRVDTPVGGS